MHPKQLQELLTKYREGKCTEEEKALVESWYLTYEQNDLPDIPQHAQEQHLAEVWQSLPVHEEQQPVTHPHRLPWWRMAAAAVLLITLGAGLYFYIRKPAPATTGTQPIADTRIVPGDNKAILTLGDGRTINLTDASDGPIAEQAGITITKKADGQLLYTVSANAAAGVNTFNTIETPKGGQYQVSLPDGSKVWLNAATTLRFPAKFSDTGRTVYLDGEAYFEVATLRLRSGQKMPFRVSLQGQEVEVLGTHFNVMAYKDEGTIRTTLLEGAVQLITPETSALLRPGQQGYLAAKNKRFTVADADVAAVTAWKNGLFVFNGADLRTLMRQIGRWYDIDIIYEPGVKDDVVYGTISRKADLAKLLKILELGGIHFRLEGRRLIVTQ
jgi:ferric-dicitrate binding protein FerR (iron transport regulator)